MQVLRASAYKRMPWKNGGGETVEIAVFPDAAGLADFDWRISMATVGSDGPFSVFPGIDRTLSILDGQGMTLFIEGRDPVLLEPNSAPLAFPADAPTSATLAGGTITDLNVMTRRGKLSHHVERLVIAGTAELTAADAQVVLFCADGRAKLSGGDWMTTLGHRDCVILGGAAGELSIRSERATVFVVTLENI